MEHTVRKPPTLRESLGSNCHECLKPSEFVPAIFVCHGGSMKARCQAPHLHGCRAAIAACRRGGRWAQAAGLLMKMGDAGLLPDSMSHGGVLQACETGHRWDCALHVLATMGEATLEPSVIVFTILLGACAKAQQWLRALGALEEAQGLGVSADVTMHSAAITAQERAGEWELGLSLFARLCLVEEDPGLDVAAFGAAICACAVGAHWRLALQLLCQMTRLRLRPSAACYGSTISSCEKAGKWLELFQRICADMVLPNMIILGAAISACEKGSQWKPALALLHFGQQEDIYMDVICYSAAISACEKCSMWQTAFSVLEDMRRSLVRCDTVALCSSISACEKSSEWQMALETHLEARSVHLQPDIIACNAAMSSCAKRNRWAHASLLLALAEEPSVVSCSVAIAACTAFWELAMAFLTFMAMRRLAANAASRSSAADACAGAGRWRLALRAAQRAKGGAAANAALRGLAEAKEWSAALAFLGRMTADATSYCSTIESCSPSALHMARLLSDVQQLELRVLPLRCAPGSLTSFAKESLAGTITTAAISEKVGICKGNPLGPPCKHVVCCEVEEQGTAMEVRPVPVIAEEAPKRPASALP
eukprot:s2948_g7.t1